MKTPVIIWSSDHDDPDDNNDEDPDDGDLDDEDTNDDDGDNAGQSELLARGSHLLQPARPSWLQKEGGCRCDSDVYGVDHAEDDKVDQGDADDYSANDDDDDHHTLAGEVHIMMICCWSCCCWWWWCPLPMIIMVVLQELLQEKLTIAISNAEGFGLE